MTTRSKVAVLYTQPENVIQDTVRLCNLAGMSETLDHNATTILKENISWHFPMPSANTTPWQMEGAIQALHQSGIRDLVCVQNKTVVSNAVRGARLNCFGAVLEHYGIPIRYNYDPSHMLWTLYTPKAELLVLNRIFPEGIKIPDFMHGKNIVHLPTAKCHMYTTTTGAMKNAFGGLLSTYRHYTHSWIHETLVDLLAIQREIHPGIFAIMDATTAGNGPGPRTMTPVVKNVMLASPDPVAIDAISAKMMGFDPLSIPYIRIAHERGLGVGDPREIEQVGDDIYGVNWGFKVGNNFHRTLAWFAWYGPTKFLQRLVLHTPLVGIPIMISKVNHDYVHWPLKESHIYEQWRQETNWGKLFQRYQQGEFLGNK
jgi:uncharacterized protein (DUF362 family)